VLARAGETVSRGPSALHCPSARKVGSSGPLASPRWRRSATRNSNVSSRSRGVAADPAAALALIGSARVSMANARWLTDFVPTAKAALKGEAAAFSKEILDSISGDAKPNLKLIDNGGPSRA